MDYSEAKMLIHEILGNNLEVRVEHSTETSQEHAKIKVTILFDGQVLSESEETIFNLLV